MSGGGNVHEANVWIVAEMTLICEEEIHPVAVVRGPGEGQGVRPKIALTLKTSQPRCHTVEMHASATATFSEVMTSTSDL